ncbi:TadE/TadG family type IV pilus assembly protein [Marinobacter litoralis]|uniref:TadE/TadG family type IV pilus assembly protein n=1 Tax=Marinobacter litoralis TaxID=187981 RepID=UPI0018EB2926|nr:TadE/TadG family type IV pilus assembly protein [Marinobacter litoralis]MBJ6138622.1 pilus assembly protein [Marinobacter litoralis]
MQISRNRNAGVVALEFIFILPLLIGLLYGALVYGLLFFHKLEMQQVVDRASSSVFFLDRRQHQTFSDEVVAHSKASLGKLVAGLPTRLRTRLSEQVCENVSSGGVDMLECRLSADGTKPFLPQLKLGFLGSFPPQPAELSVTAAVAF